MAKAKMRPDGRLECGVCGQALHESQNVCPSCKEPVTGVEKGERLKQNTDRKPVRSQKAYSAWLYAALAVVALAIGFWATIGRTLWTQTSKVENGILVTNMSKHAEEPQAPVYEGRIGFDYWITQVFFKAEEDDDTVMKVKAVLDAVALDYENFYYTEKGYYTADLKGLGSYTKNKYDERVAELSEAIKAQMEVQELYGIQFTIEGWYKIPQ